jgi:DNA-binding transcriptional LysR family regulator
MADRRLQVFYTVAKQLSFTKAAEILFMTQPAVTFQVKQLEEHFNTRLFERSHSKITLTPAGEVALEYAEKILSMTTEMETRLGEMTGQVSGILMVGASTTIAEYMLPRLLGDFKNEFPQVQARLTVANSETIESKVADHTLDVGLIEAPSRDTQLTCEVCCEDELVVICAPNHPVAKLKDISPQKLIEIPYVSRETGSGTREVVDSYFREAGVNPDDLNIVMELGSREAIKGAVEAGLGIAIVSRSTISKELKLGDLVAIPLKPKLMRPLSVVYAKERFRSRLLQTFLDFINTSLKKPLRG